MKKILSLILAIGFIAMCLCGCGNRGDSDTVDYISLDVSNCYYYLSIRDNYYGTNSIGNPIREIEINGALNGVYSNCVLTFEYGSSSGTGTKQTITVVLNAAGFTCFNYTYYRLDEEGIAKVIDCSGKVYFDVQKYIKAT